MKPEQDTEVREQRRLMTKARAYLTSNGDRASQELRGSGKAGVQAWALANEDVLSLSMRGRMKPWTPRNPRGEHVLTNIPAKPNSSSK